jgi:hypothetical protein
MVTIETLTGYLPEQIETFTLPVSTAVLRTLKAENKLTAMLIVRAVMQNNQSVVQGLLSVAAFEAEHTQLSHELYEYRNWLQSLLA